MRRVFDFEGPIFSFFSRFADLIWLNVLYIVCCLPIITIGAATTAMHYVTLKMVKDEESYITKMFFKSFISNFKQATVIWLLYMVVIFIMISDFMITYGGSFDALINIKNMSNVVLVVVAAVAVVIVITLTYVFPLLAQFDNTVMNTIKNSFIIGVRHLPYTILMVIIALVPFVIMYYAPPAILLILIVFSCIAYTNSNFYKKIFERYMPKEENDNVEESAVTESETDINA